MTFLRHNGTGFSEERMSSSYGMPHIIENSIGGIRGHRCPVYASERMLKTLERSALLEHKIVHIHLFKLCHGGNVGKPELPVHYRLHPVPELPRNHHAVVYGAVIAPYFLLYSRAHPSEDEFAFRVLHLVRQGGVVHLLHLVYAHKKSREPVPPHPADCPANRMLPLVEMP